MASLWCYYTSLSSFSFSFHVCYWIVEYLRTMCLPGKICLTYSTKETQGAKQPTKWGKIHIAFEVWPRRMTHKNELNYSQSSGITTWLCTSGTVKQYCKNWKQAYGSHKQWQLERVGLFSPFSILSVLGWISTSERLITLWRSTEMVSHNEKSQHQTMTKAGSCQILRLSGLFYLLLWWLFSIKIQDKK